MSLTLTLNRELDKVADGGRWAIIVCMSLMYASMGMSRPTLDSVPRCIAGPVTLKGKRKFGIALRSVGSLPC